MIDKAEDLGFKGKESNEQVLEILKEKLGVSLDDMTAALQQYVQQHAEELATNFLVVIPHEDYTKGIEDQGKIAKFFREDASLPVNWVLWDLHSTKEADKLPMLKISFHNKAVDEGDSMHGHVLLNFGGKILHAFVHGDP
jgi:hypothetical protein